MAKKKFKKVNPKWFRHEALHTSYIAADLVAEQLQEHWYYTSGINPEFNKKIDEAVDALMDAYQLVGQDRTYEIKKHIKIERI
jgi:hypothetical protein